MLKTSNLLKNTKYLFFLVLSLTISSCAIKTEKIDLSIIESNLTCSFSVTADMRKYTGDAIGFFRGAVESINLIGPGDFMISPGDIDPPERVLYTIHKYIDEDYIWYPAVGNHETGTKPNMKWLREYNSRGNTLPNIVNTGPPGAEETMYSFDYENAHFIILNEYYDGKSDTGTDGNITDPVYNWLMEDLNMNHKPVIFVIGHEPAFPEADAESKRIRHKNDCLNQYPENRDRFWNLLSEYSVTAYICGHTHNYSAIEINGVWQIDAGHSRGIRDRDSRSTYILFYIFENNSVWYYTYRRKAFFNLYLLTEKNQIN